MIAYSITKIRHCSSRGLTAIGAVLLFTFSTTQFSFAHGTVTSPPSRVYLCYLENPESPDSPPCIDAVAMYGTQGFYDYNGINQGMANGNHQAVVPDGNLGSGGFPMKYGGIDQVRSDWISTPVAAGPLTVTWTNSAPHATLYYQVYITTDDWTSDMPLTWAKLELLHETAPSAAASLVDIDVTLPARNGHHVIYSVWQRSDSQEAFYSTSDVDFGGNPPPPPPVANKVIVEDDLEVVKSVLVNQDLTVDSMLRARYFMIDDLNPELNFSSDEDSKYLLRYAESTNRFVVEEVGVGSVIEISGGEIYFPQYANGNSSYLALDPIGKMVEQTQPSQSLNRYDFPPGDQATGFTTTRRGLHFASGTELAGITSYLMDNDALTGSADNSIIVRLIRVGKTSTAIPEQTVFEVIADNTAAGVFGSFVDDSPEVAGYNLIDNVNFIYFLEISRCDDCDFRVVTIDKD